MRDIHFPGRSVVMSTQGMVSTSQPMATQAGLDVLKTGGNAMDAAIAASAVLCVTEPFSTGIGGDCFLLYHEASSGQLHGLNGSGAAPARATVGEYRRRGLDAVPERGPLSVTVPGAIDAWQVAAERFGSLGLGELLQPAIAHAENGYAITPVVHHVWQKHEALLAKTPRSAETMLENGRAPGVGTLHRQPNLAKTLRLIAEQGGRTFYEGPIAKAIADTMREHDGLIGEEDLAAHQSEWVDPIHTDYRGLRLYEIPPNGQGITALMALNILENLNFGALKHLSVEYIHTLTETVKLALAERDRFVSDMRLADIPIETLLGKEFGMRQYERFNAGSALPFPLDSGLNGAAAQGAPHKDTVYLTVVDKDRNCCSFINSLFHAFGSGVVAGDSGVMLQNRGACFVVEDDHFNAIAPGKRPLHTIIPAMAYRGKEPVLSFGVMGGHYQAMGHAYAFTNWLDFGMDVQQALDAPRFMPRLGQLQVERGISETTREGLRKLGHDVVETEMPLGGGQIIYIDSESGVLSAGSDPRKDGCAMGY
ncbi:MAG: gamma-glutamyltransferase [bacterium]